MMMIIIIIYDDDDERFQSVNLFATVQYTVLDLVQFVKYMLHAGCTCSRLVLITLFASRELLKCP